MASRYVLTALCARSAAAAAFTAGNLLLTRLGDGSAQLPSTATTVAMFIDEMTTSGAVVQSVTLPTTTSGALRAITLPAQNPLLCESVDQNGAPGSVGLLTRSVDGRFVTVAGIDVGTGAAFEYQSPGSGDPGPNVYQASVTAARVPRAWKRAAARRAPHPRFSFHPRLHTRSGSLLDSNTTERSIRLR